MKTNFTKYLMLATVLCFTFLGLLLSFLPEELIIFFSTGHSKLLILCFQILGSLYLGFGMINWIVKNSLIGGVYNRPIVFGNFIHFFIGTLMIFKAIEAFTGKQFFTLITIAILYSIFTINFGYLLFFNKGIST